MTYLSNTEERRHEVSDLFKAATRNTRRKAGQRIEKEGETHINYLAAFTGNELVVDEQTCSLMQKSA